VGQKSNLSERYLPLPIIHFRSGYAKSHKASSSLLP
jgi:hypothetical protein